VKDRDIKALCWRLAHCEQLFPRPAIIWPWGKEKPGGSRLIRQRLWLSAGTCNRKTSAALLLKENMWPSPGLIALRLPCDSLDRGLRGGLCLCAAIMWNISWHSEPTSTHTHKCCWAYYTSFQVGVSVTSLQLVSPNKLHDVPVGLLAFSVHLHRDEMRWEQNNRAEQNTQKESKWDSKALLLKSPFVPI